MLRPGITDDNVETFIAPDDGRVLLVAGRALRLGVVPVSRFMTGRTYCVQRLHQVRDSNRCHTVAGSTKS